MRQRIISAVLLAWLAGCAPRNATSGATVDEDRPAARAARSTPASRPSVSPVPIVELRGDAVALGESHGKQLGKTIRPLFRDYFGHYFANADERDRCLKATAGFGPFILPEHRDEIRALAASSGVDPGEAMLAQCFLDLSPAMSCSTISVPAAASPDGVARFARNLDFPSYHVADRHSVLLVFHPKDRYAFVAVSWPGMVGVLSGMNEHGLTLANMEVARHHRAPNAMPYTLLYRTLLERCKTVNEAIALLEKTPRQSANNLMLMDAAGDRAVAEITPSKVTVRRAPDTAALISTNHHRGTDLDAAGRCNRFDALHDAARRQFGRLSETSLEQMLTGVAAGSMTIQSMILEPANRVLYLAVGTDAPNHGFARIDLKPHFR